MKNKLQIIRKGYFWMSLGSIILLIALLLTLYNIYEENRAEKYAKSTIEQIQFTKQDIEDEKYIPDYIINPKIDMPEQVIDGICYIGVISIPKLDLYLPVISEWSYPNLRKAPCRYKGSVYEDNMIIAGHNYKKYFANLSQLEQGDRVAFTDINGNMFQYEVMGIKLIDDEDIEGMLEGEWDLTLFTCTYSLNSRITVRCARIK